MKKKKLMTKEDKRNYFLYQFKTEPLGALGDLIDAILSNNIFTNNKTRRNNKNIFNGLQCMRINNIYNNLYIKCEF